MTKIRINQEAIGNEEQVIDEIIKDFSRMIKSKPEVFLVKIKNKVRVVAYELDININKSGEVEI